MSHSKSSNVSPVTKVLPSTFGDESSIVTDNEAKSIHDENVQLLSGMDEAEILAERQQLMESIGEIYGSKFYLNFLTCPLCRSWPFTIHTVETEGHHSK